jgi:hypothetical protein
MLKVILFHPQRLQYSEMAINQSQSGIDDGPDIPSDLFETDRTKLARKGEEAESSFVHLFN